MLLNYPSDNGPLPDQISLPESEVDESTAQASSSAAPEGGPGDVEPPGPPEQRSDPPEQPAAASSRALLDSLSDRLDVSSWDSDESFLEEMGEFAQKAGSYDELSRLAEYGKRYAPHAADFERFLGEQGQRQQRPTADPDTQPDPKPEPLWNPPKIDPVVEQMVQLGVQNQQVKRGASGLLETDNPMFASAVQSYNSREAYRRQFFSGFESDPVDFMSRIAKEGLGGEFNSLREEMQGLKQHVAQQITQALTAPYNSQFYTETGKLTPTGDAFNKAYVEASNLRDRNGRELSEQQKVAHALHYSGVMTARTQPQRTTPAAPAPEKKPGTNGTHLPGERRETFVKNALNKAREKRATPSPNRNGAEAAARELDIQTNPEQDFLETAMADAKAAGLDLSS